MNKAHFQWGPTYSSSHFNLLWVHQASYPVDNKDTSHLVKFLKHYDVTKFRMCRTLPLLTSTPLCLHDKTQKELKFYLYSLLKFITVTSISCALEVDILVIHIFEKFLHILPILTLVKSITTNFCLKTRNRFHPLHLAEGYNNAVGMVNLT